MINFRSAGDGDLTLRKRSSGPFLVKSGAIYDCDPTDALLCKAETLNPWVQVDSGLQKQKAGKTTCFCFSMREMGLEPTRRCHH